MNRASYVVLLPLGAKKKTTRIEVLENGTVIAGEARQGAVAIARKPSLAELEAAYGAFERRVAKFQDTFAERIEGGTNATAKCEASRDACAKALKAAEPVKATYEFDHPQPPYVCIMRFTPAHAACLKTRKGLGYTVMDLSPKTAPTE